MLLPLGLEDAEVDRFPWVGVGIGVLTFIVFFFTWVVPIRSGESDALLQSALEYWSEHPYLDLPENIENRIPPGLLDNIHDAVDEMELPKPAVYEEEQNELDARFAKFEAKQQESLFASWGLVPAKGLFQPGWLTHIFLHFGWMHLIGNLFFFYFSAPLVEDRWGHLFFAAFYIVGGLVAGLAQALLDLDSQVTGVGASGAVAACMGALAFLYPKKNMRLLFLLFVIPIKRFSLPVWIWSVGWFLMEVYSLVDVGAASSVAFMAHIGGWLFGFGAAAVINFTGLERRLRVEDLQEPEPSPTAFMPGFITTLVVLIVTSIIIRIVPDKRVRPTGEIMVTSTPGDAMIYINGRATGLRTPETVPGLRPRRPYRVQVGMAGYRSAPLKTVVIIPRSLERPTANFELHRVGTFHVTSEPPGASVYLDTRYRGVTPVTLPARKVGKKVAINVDKDGFFPIKMEQSVTAGTSTVNLTLLPAKKIDIESEPSGATVTLDGQKLGQTPLTSVSVPATKRFRLRFERVGFSPKQMKLRRPKEGRRVMAKLKMLPLHRLPLTRDERREVKTQERQVVIARKQLARAKRDLAAAERRLDQVMSSPRFGATQRIKAEDRIADLTDLVDRLEITVEDASAMLGTIRERVISRVASSGSGP